MFVGSYVIAVTVSVDADFLCSGLFSVEVAMSGSVFKETPFIALIISCCVELIVVAVLDSTWGTTIDRFFLLVFDCKKRKDVTICCGSVPTASVWYIIG